MMQDTYKPEQISSNLARMSNILSFKLSSNIQIQQVISTQNFLQHISFELKVASEAIKFISQQRRALKMALADTIKKKDQLYTQAKFFHQSYISLKNQSSQLANEQKKAHQANSLLHSLKSSLSSNQKVIFQLRQQLERPLDSKLKAKLLKLSEKCLKNRDLSPLFYQHLKSKSSLKELFDKKQIESLLFQLLSFIDSVMEFMPVPSQNSPDFLQTLPLQINRVAKLNQEMLNTMSRSREILSKPSSPPLMSPTVKTPPVKSPPIISPRATRIPSIKSSNEFKK